MSDWTLPPLLAGAPVFMFSGQGSQKPGMGGDLLAVKEVKETFSCASDVLGYDVADLVLNADPDELNDTRNAQPALCVLSVGIAHALMARGVQPAAVLGFSLGQVSALAVSGMLSDEATFALVKARSELMAEAAAAHPGVMSALLKADEDVVAALCEQCAEGEVLVPANFNCPGQIVIAGAPAAVERAEAAWAEAGKRSSRLATSGAFHSPLMADAAAGLAAYLENVEFSEARIPLVCNVTAAPLSAADARENLVRHLTSPVRFDASVAALTAAGADMFVEVGFGGVLANLVKRIDKTATRACVQDESQLRRLPGRRFRNRFRIGASTPMTNETETPRRSAVVTGSNRGIGRAVAEELARAGFDVCVNCSSERGLDEARAFAAALEADCGVRAIAVAANVADAAEAAALVDAAQEAFGRVDVLVNNAGITRDGLLARMKDEDFDAVIDVNLKGTFNCCKAAAQRMMKQRYGRIVNMSSVVGVAGNAGQANYAASKAGVIGLTKSIARELAARNVTANAVAPGFIATDMTDALSEKQREAIVGRIASKRLGEPEDVAKLVRFLASEDAGYITGQVVCIDGGMSL